MSRAHHTGPSIAVYKDRQKYEEWEFVYTPQNNAAGGIGGPGGGGNGPNGNNGPRRREWTKTELARVTAWDPELASVAPAALAAPRDLAAPLGSAVEADAAA
ncbi:MAG: hypothetical protein WDO18_16335 [Acidobacteriota bacterium]